MDSKLINGRKSVVAQLPRRRRWPIGCGSGRRLNDLSKCDNDVFSSTQDGQSRQFQSLKPLELLDGDTEEDERQEPGQKWTRDGKKRRKGISFGSPGVAAHLEEAEGKNGMTVEADGVRMG
jgi:hypothetical protein